MLQKFRNLSQSIFFKFILGLILLSFLFSGVRGMSNLSLSFSEQFAVKVGREAITQNEIDGRYNQLVQSIRRSGKDFSEEQLASMGVSREQITRNLVQDSLIRQQVKDLGVQVGDDSVSKQIKLMQEFQVDGQFDKQRFHDVVAQRGLREDKFLGMLRNDLSNGLLITPLIVNLPVNDSVAKKTAQYNAEQRDIDVITIPANFKKLTKKPTDKDYDQFYFENSYLFQVPEQRNITYVTLPNRNNKDKEAYEVSNQIEDDLAGGATLEEVSKKYSLPIDKELNLVKDNGKFSPTFTATAFGTEVSESSNIVEDETKKSFVIRVDKVFESRIPELKEVKDKVAAAWVVQKQKETNQVFAEESVSKITEAGGIKAYAAKNGLKVQQIKSASKVNATEGNKEVVASAFREKVGVAFGPIEQADGSFKIGAVAAVKTVEPKEEEITQAKAQLSERLQVEILDQYLGYLSDKFPIVKSNNAQKPKAKGATK